MAQFTKEMFDRLMTWEGGYSNHPNDAGGKTLYGIAYNASPTAFDQVFKLWDNGKNPTAALEFAKSHYEKNYFNACSANKINDSHLAEQVFDIAVNMGVGRAVRMLQDSVNNIMGKDTLKVDGVLGPKSQEMINALNVIQLNNELVEERVNFYNRLVTMKPKNKVFLKGWLRRANSFLLTKTGV